MTPQPRRSVFPGFDRPPGSPSPVITDLVSKRRRAGVSQAEVARRMGTSQPAVARLESGDTDARLSTLARYAAALDQDLVWNIRARKER